MNEGRPTDSKYGDRTGYMGYSYRTILYPRKCFNGSKSWQLDLYEDRRTTVNPIFSYITSPFDDTKDKIGWKGKLVGASSYNLIKGDNNEDEYNIIVKVERPNIISGSLFLMYNEKKGINEGADYFENNVTIVSSLVQGSNSKLEKALGEPGEKIVDYGTAIELCSISYGGNITTGNVTKTYPTYAEISIFLQGIQSSAC